MKYILPVEMTSIKNGDYTSEEYDKSFKLEVTTKKDSSIKVENILL